MLALAFVAGCLRQDSDSPPPPRRVLVYTVSAGYEHEVVRRGEDGGLSLVERAMEDLGRADPAFDVSVTRDADAFDRERLADVDLVFFYTTGELPLSSDQRAALLDRVREGGAFVGAHCATDTFYEYPEYLEMVGGRFDGHPWHQEVRVRVEDRDHPSTRHLDESFAITDEIYQFGAPYDRASVDVLLSLDTESVDVTRDSVRRTDGDFALAWCRSYGEGRVFYTALGHRPEVWADARFQQHLVGGIRWALGLAALDEPAGHSD